MKFDRLTGVRLLAIAAALVLSSCGQQNASSLNASVHDSDGIVGGQPVRSNDPIAKSIVALYSEEESGGMVRAGTCTGTVISEAFVLTAAHCLPGKNSQMVVMFSRTMDAKAAMRPVVAMAAHPRFARIEALMSLPKEHRDKKVIEEFEKVGRGDIALLRFAGGLPAGYTPARISDSLSFLKDGSSVTLAGFGMSNPTAKGKQDNGTGTLRRVDVQVGMVNFKSGELLMDQRFGKGACKGDSGGPALAQAQNGQFIVFGVTSAGMGPEREKCIGVSAYTSIPAYLPWLNKAAAALARVNAREAVNGTKIHPIEVEVAGN